VLKDSIKTKPASQVARQTVVLSRIFLPIKHHVLHWLFLIYRHAQSGTAAPMQVYSDLQVIVLRQHKTLVGFLVVCL